MFPPSDTTYLYPTRLPFEESSVFSGVNIQNPYYSLFPKYKVGWIRSLDVSVVIHLLIILNLTKFNMTCVSGKPDDPYCKAETLSISPHILHFYHSCCIMDTWSDLHRFHATSNLINRHPKTDSLIRLYSQSCEDRA